MQFLKENQASNDGGYEDDRYDADEEDSEDDDEDHKEDGKHRSSVSAVDTIFSK